MSEFTPAELLELEGLIAERAEASVRAFMTQRLVTPHDAPGLFAFNGANPNIDQTRKASIDSTRDNLNDLNSRLGGVIGNYLPLTGGTLSGNLDVGGGVNTFPHLSVNAAAGANNAEWAYKKGGSYRWSFLMTAEAEAGANAGSNLQQWRYTDAGSAQIWQIANRASGSLQIFGQLYAVDPTANANGTFAFGNQAQGNRSLAYVSTGAPAGYYTLGGTIPLYAAAYRLASEPQIAVAGNVTVDLTTSSAFLLLVTATGTVTMSNQAFFGHVQFRVAMQAAATLTFAGVSGWLGEAGPPTFLNGATYFVNFFFVGAGCYGQVVKVGA